MAEETVKRVTGINPLLLAMSNLSGTGVPPTVNSSINESANAAVPMQRNSNQLFHQTVPGMSPTLPHHQRLDGSFPGNSSTPLPGSAKNNVTLPSDVRGGKLPEQLGPSEALPSWSPEVAQQGVAKINK